MAVRELNKMTTEELYSIYINCKGKVSTDSRKIQGGEIYFALKGDKFDANDFAVHALEKGAVYAVVDRPSLIQGVFSDRLILVQDSLSALQQLASLHRTRLKGGKLPLIGLTGTNGKTTTKNLIREVLSKKYKVGATEGNLNNDVGLPLSLLSMSEDIDVAIVEMGASHPGDIERLARVCRPNFGLITNVGLGHIQGFGSFEGVKAAKSELYKWLGKHPGSVIFINEDDSTLKELARGLPCHFFGYGQKYWKVEIITSEFQEPYLNFKIDGRVVKTKLVGEYNLNNALAAIAVGERLGVDRKAALDAIEAYTPENIRSQLLKTSRNTLVIDAYNANPSSMRAAIENFAKMKAPLKLALLGDMKELGEVSISEHQNILQLLKSKGLEAILVGPEFKNAVGLWVKNALSPESKKVAGTELKNAARSSTDFQCFENTSDLSSYLLEHPVQDSLILLKGSRSMGMEKLVYCL